MTATGRNIVRLRKQCGLTVRDVQEFFGFEEPQAVYKWQQGKSLPNVDNLFALSFLFGVPMNDILVRTPSETIDTHERTNSMMKGQWQDCPSVFVMCFRYTKYAKKARRCGELSVFPTAAETAGCVRSLGVTD